MSPIKWLIRKVGAYCNTPLLQFDNLFFEILHGGLIKLFLAGLGTEIVGLSIILTSRGRFLLVHLHSADRIFRHENYLLCVDELWGDCIFFHAFFQRVQVLTVILFSYFIYLPA